MAYMDLFSSTLLQLLDTRIGYSTLMIPSVYIQTTVTTYGRHGCLSCSFYTLFPHNSPALIVIHRLPHNPICSYQTLSFILYLFSSCTLTALAFHSLLRKPLLTPSHILLSPYLSLCLLS